MQNPYVLVQSVPLEYYHSSVVSVVYEYLVHIIRRSTFIIVFTYKYTECSCMYWNHEPVVEM